MGIKRYLSKREKYDLITFVAGTGENYGRYKEFAESRGWKLYSPAYFHKWVWRNTPAIKAQRAIHVERIRELSMYNREKRIEELENAIIILDRHLVNPESEVAPHKCDYCGELHETLGPEVVIKLMEQKRKLLEQIAKERNEWLKADETGRGPASLVESFRELARRELAGGDGETEVIPEEPLEDGMDED